MLTKFLEKAAIFHRGVHRHRPWSGKNSEADLTGWPRTLFPKKRGGSGVDPQCRFEVQSDPLLVGRQA